MSYLRFTRDDYRALCRLCSPHLTHALHPRFFRRLLLSRLSAARPALAERVAGLEGHQLGILFDHLRRRHPAGTGGERHAFRYTQKKICSVAVPPGSLSRS
jgi:hypothetical protein